MLVQQQLHGRTSKAPRDSVGAAGVAVPGGTYPTLTLQATEASTPTPESVAS